MPFRRFVPAAHLAGALAIACGAAAAHADTLYQQTYTETAAGGWLATEAGGYTQADSFSTTVDGTITSVNWYGMDLNERTPGIKVNPSSFTISIYANGAGNQPGDLLSTSLVGQSGGAVDTGTDYQDLNVYSFTRPLSAPLQVHAGTTYWLEINDPTDNGNWLWAAGTAPGGDGTHLSRTPASGGSFESSSDDLAFVLTGTALPVPEPAPLALLAGGVLAIGATRRVRRRA